MFFENYYINYSNDLTINSISSYRNIMNKFIIKFIVKNKLYYTNKNELYNDAFIYAKYYLYWQIYSCIYQDNIMNILYDIEYMK